MILFFQQVQVAPILLQLFKSRNESAYERPNAFHMAQAILSARWTFHTAAKEKIKQHATKMDFLCLNTSNKESHI